MNRFVTAMNEHSSSQGGKFRTRKVITHSPRLDDTVKYPQLNYHPKNGNGFMVNCWIRDGLQVDE